MVSQLWIAFGLSVLSVFGCQRPLPNVVVSVVVPTSSLANAESHAETAFDPFRRGARGARVWGGVNETLDFQFAITTGDVPVDSPVLRVSPLVSSNARIEPTAFRLFRMQPVPLAQPPGWNVRSFARQDRLSEPLDCLVPIDAPRGGLPTRLASKTRYEFWADLTIPKGAFEGVYVGEIQWVSGARTIATLPIELTVKPFVLPDRPEIPMIASLDHRALFRHHVRRDERGLELASDDWRDDPRRDELDGLLQATMRMLESHHLTPVLSRLTPPLRVTAQQGASIDWEPYDEVATPCLNGRMFADRTPVSVWPVPLPETLITGRDVLSPSAVQVRRRYLASCVEHFRGKGWLEQAYMWPVCAARPIGGSEAPRYRASMNENNRDVLRSLSEWGSLVNDVPSELRVVVPWFPQDMRSLGWMGDPIPSLQRPVIWAPSGQFFDRDETARRRPAGDSTWWVVDRPPFTGTTSVFGSATDARVLSWQAEREGASAIVLGEVNEWPPPDDSPRPTDCVVADASVLLYPGGSFGLTYPVESVRLKHLRRSQQDGAYRRLLTEKGLEHVRDTLTQAIAPYAGTGAVRTHFADGKPNGWPDDDAWFELAREIMAEEIVRAGNSASEPGDSPFVRTAAWRRFMLELREPRMWVDGCRVRELEPAIQRGDVSVECFATVQNVSRVPISGRLQARAEATARVTSDREAILGNLPPDASRTIAYSFSLSEPPSADGAASVALELMLADGGRLTSEARVALVTAPFLPTGPKIDGDLRDWAPSAGNAATGFRTLPFGKQVGAGAEATPEARRPANATAAFFRRDAEDLYVGVSANWSHAVDSTITGNSVVYQDLVPVGEELVEIVIDPLNAGTRSPSDLFHIAVKPTGAVLTEKGIRFDPPCGERRTWNADVVSATRTTTERWTAELRIPLASFGPLATDSPIWGINVTRFDLANREFSTWSGAVGNAYDPLSLGNLRIPAASAE